MRLQQAVLGFAKKAISLVENVIFLVIEAADLLERLQSKQGVALTDLRQIAAVEQLQKLNGEFDVANASMSGFDLGVAGACLSRFLFDTPFQSLDLVDFRKA